MTDNSVRIDRWLWAARFFKTRALAAEAVTGGKVHVNSVRAKPAKQVQTGDVLRVRSGPYEWLVTVRAVSGRRGPARVAQTLYEESSDSRVARERLAEQLRLAPVVRRKGRPTKRERRAIERLEDHE